VGKGGAYCTYREKRNWHRVWRGNVKEGEHFEGLGIEAKIILKYILRGWNEFHEYGSK
jgi:hypothetical protein